MFGPLNTVRVQKEFDPVKKPSRTKQSFKDGSDSRAIVRKYLSTGNVDVLMQNRGTARYGDFTSSRDYLEAMSQLRRAQELFEQLPSAVRDYVDNDPAALLDLVHDPERIEEVRKLGLIPEVEAPAPVPAPPAAPAAPTPPVDGGSPPSA